MGSKLFIVESPTKAKTIGKILGKDFSIKASKGHVRDLPERAFGVDIEHNFKPQYEESKTRAKILGELKAAAKGASEIYLAPDPDREGEAIAWHLQEVLQSVNKKAKFLRVSFHEITRSAINKAMNAPGEINMTLVDAQQARRVLDRIVGYQVSPLLWSRIERGVSAGRVQSVALRLVCEREREIQSFVPREYWNFIAQFEPADQKGKTFRAKLAKINRKNADINNADDAGAILAQVRAVRDWAVTELETVQRKKYATPPFITSTLQQAASSAIGFSASQTMRIAQQLYEGIDVGNGPIGLITYMRTDSVAIAQEAQIQCRTFITGEYGDSYVPPTPNNYKSKSTAQGAHEAIRPTDVTLSPERIGSFLDTPQLKLYTLIWRRFVASQMAPAIQDKTNVTVGGTAPDGAAFDFKTSAVVTRFPGFLRAYNIVEEGTTTDDDDEPRDADILAGLRKNTVCTLAKSANEQKFTEPAPRFSEATLIKELEQNGIGRPSTYATILNTIQTRQYVNREKGKLAPTELGFKINDYLVESLPELFDVGFTARMELLLDKIEDGDIEWTKMLADFYAKFEKWLKIVKSAGAPESQNAACIIRLLSHVKNWEKPEKAIGKRAFDEKKFFHSILTRYNSENKISARQWEALLSLALKYEKELPDLRAEAEKFGFAAELGSADEKRVRMNEVREERRLAREEANRTAPEQGSLPSVFAVLAPIQWTQPEKRRGRVYDDKAFFTSLKDQHEHGKLLSEKQIAALGRILEKYAEQIPDVKQYTESLGLKETEEQTAERSEQNAHVGAILKALETVKDWNPPTKTGRRVFDDREFVQSIRKQAESGKVLSPKQVAALQKLAGKYGVTAEGKR